MSQHPPGLLALPMATATCLLAGLLIALLAGPAWQEAAWALLSMPLVAFAALLPRSLSDTE